MLQQQLQGERDQRAVVEEQLTKLQTEKHRLEAKVRYYKDQASNNNNNMSVFHQKKVEALKEEVRYWQERCSEQKAQTEAFLGNHSIATFKDGRYTDTVRELYMELMSMKVGARNIQNIIHTVLNKMTGMSVDHLPGETFAKYMLLEALSLALSHLKDELTQHKDLTVGTDGTTKFGHHYAACEFSLPDGRKFVGGLRDMASGDAETYLATLKQLVEDIAASER